MNRQDVSEHARWSRIFSGSDFYYGLDPGPVARRAVRYARPQQPHGASALDVGCGEGQDLVFLVQSGYDATGLDFTATGLAKAARLLAEQQLEAHLVEADVAVWEPAATYDLVLAVNCLQFLAERAPDVLRRLQEWVAPGGVLGLSLFSRDDESVSPLESGLYRPTLSELLALFAGWQPFEAARLWQWNAVGEAQPFVILIAARP